MIDRAVVSLSAGVVAADCALPDLSQHLCRADVAAQLRWLAGARAVVGEITVGAAGEGLPGHVHGGLLAAICDEAMGWTCWMHGYAAPGASTRFDYKAAVRPGELMLLRAWLDAADGRKLLLRAELRRTDALAVAAFGDYVAIRPRDLSVFADWPASERFADPQWLARWPTPQR